MTVVEDFKKMTNYLVVLGPKFLRCCDYVAKTGSEAVNTTQGQNEHRKVVLL